MKKSHSARKYINPFIIFVLFISFLFSLAFIRTELFEIPLLLSCYQVITKIINKLWDAVSNPSVFITLIIVVTIWALRKYLHYIFSSLTEIKAGDVTAKIDSSKLSSLLSGLQLEENPKDSINLSDENLQYGVNGLQDRFCSFLLEHNGEFYAPQEFIKLYYKEADTLLKNNIGPKIDDRMKIKLREILGDKGVEIDESMINNLLNDELLDIDEYYRWLYYLSGFFSSITNLPSGIISIKNKNDKVGIFIEPNAKKYIENRVKKGN